ncbi:MAG: dephospho-CoA kinase [Lachnospiraceae bacterium]|nr:dephospho-CoA kinase [Lachnospiraceae bacterium]
MVIGITGGVGAGKSTVINYMAENFDCYAILADDVARDLQAKDAIAYKEIVDWLGEDILANDKEIDRAKLAKIVFKDPMMVEKLNDIVHPKVRTKIVELVNDNLDKHAHIAIEAALLVEAHYEDIYDELWYVSADEEVRIKRLMSDRGYSYERCVNIINNQLKDSEYRAAADYIIVNNGDLSSLNEQIKERL